MNFASPESGSLAEPIKCTKEGNECSARYGVMCHPVNRSKEDTDWICKPPKSRNVTKCPQLKHGDETLKAVKCVSNVCKY